MLQTLLKEVHSYKYLYFYTENAGIWDVGTCELNDKK